MAEGRGWQGIETAPRDGRDCLVWTYGACEAGPMLHIASYGESGGWSGWTSVDGFPTYPSHWMPLPDPPEPEAA